MNNLILERFKEVEVEVNGKMEKLETNEAYEQNRIEVAGLLADLLKGLTKLDKAVTKKEFKQIWDVFNEVLEELDQALWDFFNEYISAVYAASKSSLK